MIGIAIDGPSGAGKSTIAKALAERLGFVYVDTGAIYRTVGLYMQRAGVSLEDSAGIEAHLPEVVLDLRYEDGVQRMYLCGEDVTEKIRTPLISKYASVVSAVPRVRAFLFDMQRQMAKKNNVIMDGRDIGTVILPDADVKIFLTASAQARAGRRVAQLAEKGETVGFAETLAAIEERDARDSGRDVAPLCPAPDAVTLDTSERTLEESISAALEIVFQKLPALRIDAVPAVHAAGVKKNALSADKNRRGFYLWLRRYAAGAIRFCMRVRATGAEHEPADGPLIVCSNHTALMDVLALAVSLRRQLRYLAKSELFRIPLLAPLIRALGAYSVDRGKGDVAAIKKTLSLLSAGEVVAMFPQGTRRPGIDPAKTEVKSGIGMLVYRSGAPVLPVYIRVKNYRYRFLRKKEVIIGEPIRYEEFGFVSGGKEEYARAARLVFDRILALREREIDR